VIEVGQTDIIYYQFGSKRGLDFFICFAVKSIFPSIQSLVSSIWHWNNTKYKNKYVWKWWTYNILFVWKKPTCTEPHYCSKAFESCMNKEMTDISTCRKCGSICKHCSDLDVSRGQPVLNCKHCYLRQHIFYGVTACFDFCQWLFSQGNSDTTVISHNGRGFDHFPILKYLVDQSIVPQTIFNGSKCMYMHIARSLNIRFVDSLSFLPI
jgi:hypothetical protein